MHSRSVGIAKLGRLILPSLVLMFAEVGTAQGPAPPILSACNVLENLENLSGKLIAIRAELSIWRHGVVIPGPNCNSPIGAAGHKWPSAIHLGIPTPGTLSDSADVDAPSVRFLSGLMALLQQYRIEQKLLIPPFHISATFIGELRTAPQKPEGVWYGPGFGYGSWFPAELSLRAVRDVMITGLQTSTPEEEGNSD